MLLVHKSLALKLPLAPTDSKQAALHSMLAAAALLFTKTSAASPFESNRPQTLVAFAGVHFEFPVQGNNKSPPASRAPGTFTGSWLIAITSVFPYVCSAYFDQVSTFCEISRGAGKVAQRLNCVRPCSSVWPLKQRRHQHGARVSMNRRQQAAARENADGVLRQLPRGVGAPPIRVLEQSIGC